MKKLREAAAKYLASAPAEVTMSSKRQITLPAKMVRELGLEPGMKLEVHMEEGDIVLHPRKMGWLEYVTSGPPIYTKNRTKEEVDAYIREVREGWDRRARIAEGDSYVGSTHDD